MTNRRLISNAALSLALLNLSACSKSAPPPAAPPAAEAPPVAAEPEPAPLAATEVSEDEKFVEGVAGGVMSSTTTLEAEVVSVDQSAREAVLRAAEGNLVTVRVGKDAVNFYQVKVGDRVRVQMMRELVVEVDPTENAGPDGTEVVAGSAEKGEQPGGAMLSTSKISSKISKMDTNARTATLVFENGEKLTFDVRPDVDMSKYKVGQTVVFLLTEMLALNVEKL